MVELSVRFELMDSVFLNAVWRATGRVVVGILENVVLWTNLAKVSISRQKVQWEVIRG